MAKAKVLKIPARGDWEFAEVETDGLDLFLNEEGKLNGLSYNPKATILAEILFHNDCIVGDTFVCAHDGEGRSVGISDAQELALRRRLSDLGF